MLVEFALITPLLLLLVFLVIDFGRAINYWIDETHLASEGARLAAVGGRPGGGSLVDYIKAEADTAELREGGTTSVPAPGAKVCVDFPEGAQVGNPVRVTVSTPYNWLPLISERSGVTSSTIKGSATMRLEREPNFSAGCTA